MKAYYIVDVWERDNLDIEDAVEFEHDYDIHAVGGGYDRYECEWLVEDVCKHYFHNRDGWEIERSWRNGINIAVWDENETFIGLFSSTLEYEPTFFVSKVKE